jgi:hypothetical protein
MHFQFYKTEQKLTTPVVRGGCGLTQTQVNGITRQQGYVDYYFSMHTGYHGTGAMHYIYVHDGNPPKKDTGRIFISSQSTAGNFGSLKNRHIEDAKQVVRDNQALFLQIINNLTA